MKSLKKWITILVAFVFVYSCDVVDDPIKNNGSVTPIDTTQVLRKIVIEDFTGHQCKNCPKAAKQIKDLEALYGERIIGVGIHAGPSNFTGTSTDYPTDFRTPEGTAIYNFFGVYALPLGMVSRVGYDQNHLLAYGAWPTECQNLTDSVAHIRLNQQVAYNATTRQVTVNVDAKVLKDYSDDLKFCVMLLESDIVSPQLMPDDTRDPNYVHNHVFRDMFTTALGDVLQMSPAIRDSTYSQTVSGAVSTDWVAENCEVVSYIFNARTYEILQAEESQLIP